jgi:hypothetical protein
MVLTTGLDPEGRGASTDGRWLEPVWSRVGLPIPEDLVSAARDGVLIVKVAAKPGSRAGAVYDLRLLAAR